MRSVTLPQVLMLAVVLAAVILSQRFAPGVSANVVSVVGIAVAWLMKSPGAPDGPPAASVLPFLFVTALIGVVACGPYLGPEQRKELVGHQSVLEKCKQEGRDAYDAGAPPAKANAAFEACLSDAGVP